MIIDGTLLRELRISAGRTQADVATAVSIPVTVLSAYERGRRQPGVEIATRIVEAIGYSIRLTPKPDPVRQGRRLADVLRLAEALPYTPRPLSSARR
jgi:transcriptional regulator with XRE-family HTH domain